MEFNIVSGNIVNVPANAIVLPANVHMREGSGASRAIYEAAGRKDLVNACKEVKEKDKGHKLRKTGLATPTKAYRLNADYIIHAFVPRWRGGKHDEYSLLSSAYYSALMAAEKLSCESIAFPLLASGNNGFDTELAFDIAKESLSSFEGTVMKKVTLVVFGDNMEIFCKMQGYDVEKVPEVFNPVVYDEKTAARRKKRKELLEAGKDTAQDILDNQIEKAINWFSNEKNVDMVIDWGLSALKRVISSKCR